jgi:hypothetical protein
MKMTLAAKLKLPKAYWPHRKAYHRNMSRNHPKCLDSEDPDRLVAADIRLRQQPDEEEDDEEEDEGDDKEDDNDDGADDGYSE